MTLRRLIVSLTACLLLAPVAAFASTGGSTSPVPPSRAEAFALLENEVGGGLTARWNTDTGTARWLSARGGLTGSLAGTPAAAARAWLSDHRAWFGLSSQAVDAMAVERNHSLPSGVHVVWLRQTFGGIAAAGRGLASFTFDAGNRLVSVGADIVPAEPAGTRSISAGDALERVARGAYTCP